MSLTVWKFAGVLNDDVPITMPAGAKVIAAEVQTNPFDTRPAGRMLIMWAVVDPRMPTEQRVFHVRGTGHPLGDVGPHIATVHDGPFVWHVFEGRS